MTTEWYAVATRSTSFGQVHLGALYQDRHWGWMVASEFSLPGDFGLAVEYLRSAPGEGYASICFSRALNEVVYASMYYSKHYSSSAEDLVGFYLSFRPFRMF